MPRPGSAFDVLRQGARLLAGFVRAQPWSYTIATLGATVFAAAVVGSSLVVGWLVDELVVPVLEDGAPIGGALRVGVGLVLGVATVKAVGIVVRRVGAGWLQLRTQQRVRLDLIDRLLRLSLGWYSRRSVGDLLSVSDNDTSRATSVLAPLPYASGVALLMLGSIAVISTVEPVLGLLAAVQLVLVVGLDLFGSWRAFRAMEEVQRRRGVLAGVAHESFDGVITVRALGREDREQERFTGVAEDLRDALITVGRTWTGFRAITETIPNVGTVVILVIGVLRVVDGTLQVGDLVTVAYLLFVLGLPLQLIGYLLWDVANGLSAWQRVERVLEADEAVTYGDAVASPATGSGADVRVEGVTFGYGSDVTVLEDVELGVAPGSTVAIVGPTASGKSSLVLLLARLWDPDDGAIRIDGRDLRELGAGAIPDEVAFVPQEPFLFDGSVLDNVTLGDPSIDRGRCIEALEMAGVLDVVMALPQGPDTPIGERGATLSGGQRQRVALARALARRPRLLILDDATSAVDPSIESAILRRVRDAAMPSTVVMVAYRRATIMLADEVVYVEDGRILDRGTHDELLVRSPGYARLLRAYEDDRRERAGRFGPPAPRPPTAPSARRPDEPATKDLP